jgi:hypothetical protein
LWSAAGTAVVSTTGGDAMMDAIQVAVPAAGSVAAVTIGTMSAADYWRSLTLAFLPAAPAIDVATSTQFADGDATTAQLTAPSGKTTADFAAGVMVETDATANAVDVPVDDYTEIEWALKVQAPAVDTDVYQFRVTSSGTVIDTYTVTPTITVGSVAVNLVVADAAHGHSAANVDLVQQHNLAVDNTAHAHSAGNVTLALPGAGFFDDFWQNDGAPEGWITPPGPTNGPLTVVDGRMTTPAGSTTKHDGAFVHGVDVSGDWEIIINFDATGGTVEDDGGVAVMLVSGGLVGWGLFIGDYQTTTTHDMQWHIQRWYSIAGAHDNVTNNGGHPTNGVIRLTYTDATSTLRQEMWNPTSDVWIAADGDNTHVDGTGTVAGAYLIVALQSDLDTVPSRVWIDNLIVNPFISAGMPTEHGTITVFNALHGHSAASVGLVVDLTVASCVHAHTADNVDLTQGYVLTVASATHTHSAGAVVLVVDLIVASAVHAHAAGNVALVQQHVLAVDGAVHAHLADNVTLAAAGSFTLTVQSAGHGHTADNVVLGFIPILVIANALHTHTASNVTLSFGVGGLVLNLAIALRPGTATATKAYVGGTQVWP